MIEGVPKQVIVVRKDLKMRKGKLAAQVAHASLAVFFNMMESEKDPFFSLMWYRFAVERDSSVHKWIEGCFTKICVYVNSEAELIDVYREAKDAKLLCALITDAGFTEFHGVPTNTCVSIGPDYPERIDPITGTLPLL